MVLTPRRWRQVRGKIPRNDGGKRARSPGRARRKPLKPLRGECRAISGVTVVTNACAFYTTHAAAARTGRPAFPAPSDFRERIFMANLAWIARRDREAVAESVWLFEIESSVSASFLHLSRGERSRASCERVRGYSLTLDRNPSPQPSPKGRGSSFSPLQPASKPGPGFQSPPTAGGMTFVRHSMQLRRTSNALPQSGDMIPFEPGQKLCA